MTQLAALRRARGWTPQVLARAARVPITDIQALERGESFVYRKRLLRIAEALGAPYGILFDANDRPRPSGEPRGQLDLLAGA